MRSNAAPGRTRATSFDKRSEAAYRADLRKFPENGWSLFGLAKALGAQRKNAEAAAVEARFQKAWRMADVTLAGSRF